jgi:hypothetical protein
MGGRVAGIPRVSMAEYEVTIAESVAPGGGERVSSPMVRTVDWHGEAESEDAAREAAWAAWDEQYGADPTAAGTGPRCA